MTAQYCPGCSTHVPAFTGDHCPDCEQYCIENYGPCVRCEAQGYANAPKVGDLCMKHFREERL